MDKTNNTDNSGLPDSDEEEIVIIEMDGLPYEIIDELEYKGKSYIAVTPYTEDEEDDEIEFTVLRKLETSDEDGQTVLELEDIDNESLLDEIAEKFLKQYDEKFN